MPESKSRKKPTRPKDPQEPTVVKAEEGNPRWLVPTMLALLVVGLVWVVVTYVTSAKYPVPGIGNANLAIGFVVMFAGFALTLRWR